MPSTEEAVPEGPRKLHLLVASFLMLFVELALIRGTAANVVYLTFFTNFILLASFLGIGIGFLRAGARDRFEWMPVLLIVVLAFVTLVPATIGFTGGVPRFAGFGGGWAVPAQVSLPVIFLLTTAVMACIGQRVGRLFSTFAPLDAYRLDVLGSIAGIVTFSVLSFLHAGPVVWGVVVVVCCAFLLGRRMPRWTLASLALLGVLLALVSAAPRDVWSPYYRVTVAPPNAEGQIAIRVNGRPHQTMVPVEDLLTVRPFYGALYGHLTTTAGGLGNVAIIGAGSGNDVALALSKGATHVDAVEIDPVIQQLGAEMHPSHPYDDPRVSVHIDDGRAFLEQSDDAYDLVLFALPDSLTLVSSTGALRLESYLFTTESIEAVKARLRPDGVFAMYNFYRPDVFDRYAATLAQVFGHPPCLDLGEPGAGTRRQGVLTIGLQADSVSCSTLWQPSATTQEPATDDHPFPYLRGRSIPNYYLIALAAIVLTSLAAGARRRRSPPRHAELPRPVLHGRGVPAAGDEERRAVRAALRHHVVRELAGLRGDPAVGVRGRRARSTRASAAAGRPVSAAGGEPVAGVPRAARPAAGARSGREVRRRPGWSRSRRYCWRTSSSRSGSRTSAPPRWRSPPTCWAR